MTTLSVTKLRSLFRWRRAPQARTARAAFGGDNDPVLVYTAANVSEADLVIALLASEDIPAYAAGASLSQAFGLQVGPLAEVRVFVARALAPRARQIVEERHEGHSDVFSSDF